MTPKIGNTLSSYCHSQIGILRWMVELRCIDIITEVSELSFHPVLRREGHLEVIFVRIYSQVLCHIL